MLYSAASSSVAATLEAIETIGGDMSPLGQVLMSYMPGGPLSGKGQSASLSPSNVSVRKRSSAIVRAINATVTKCPDFHDKQS